MGENIYYYHQRNAFVEAAIARQIALQLLLVNYKYRSIYADVFCTGVMGSYSISRMLYVFNFINRIPFYSPAHLAHQSDKNKQVNLMFSEKCSVLIFRSLRPFLR